MKKLIIIGLFIAALNLYADDNKGVVMVTAHGFKNDKGTMLLDIYKKNDFGKSNGFIHIKGKIKNGRCEIKIDNFSYGEYAVRVVHDENENEKMDMGIFGTEGFGSFKNVKLKKQPKFEDMAFSFDKNNNSPYIKVKYPSIFDFIAAVHGA